MTAPAAIALTTPALVIEAIAELLLLQVPPVEGVTFVVPPIQTEVVPPNAGAPGIALINTFAEAGEVQLLALVTVNVYVVLAGRLVTVKLVPEPVYVFPPGDRVIVHEPEAGSPLRTALPVGVVQVGWVMVPTTGAL